MIVVFESVLPIFALVLTGFALRKSGAFAAAKWQIIEEVCFWLFFPALLILTLARTDLGSLSLGRIGMTTLATALSIMAVLLVLRPLLARWFNIGAAAYTSIFQTSTRWHAFTALAIVLKLYGDAGGAIVAIVLALLVPLLNVVNIVVLAIYASGIRPSLFQTLRAIAGNPIILSCILGIAINLSGMSLWPPIITYLDLIGRAALGSSLLALGAGLSVNALLNTSGEVLIGVFFKLIAAPALTVLFGLYFGITAFELGVLLVCASVPTSVNGFIVARKMGGDAELYAATSTVQTVLSFVTIPLVIWLGGML